MLIHAEMWQEREPLRLWASDEVDFAHDEIEGASEQEQQPTSSGISSESAIRTEVVVYVPGVLEATVGAGERRPGASDWKRGGGNERLRGCRARIMFTSLATYFGMKLRYDDA